MKLLLLGDRSFDSRLFLGTGKFASPDLMAASIEASGTQMVTVALRRVRLDGPDDDLMMRLVRHELLQTGAAAL